MGRQLLLLALGASALSLEGPVTRRGAALPATAVAAPTYSYYAEPDGERTLAHLEVPFRGAASRRPLVILHGLLGQKRNFKSWAEQLHRELSLKRRIVTLDLRGHGDSFWDDAMDYDVMASDVLATLRALGIDDCCLLGHSMGGKVAMTCALREPDAVRELCVLDIAPTAYSTTDGSNWKQNAELIAALHALPLAAVRDRRHADDALAESGVSDPNLRAFALANLDDGPNGFEWKFDLDAVVRNLDRLTAWPPNYAVYPGDALFLKGAKSKYVRSVHLPVISKNFPSFTLQTVKDCGHWLHAENPTETIADIVAYLDRDGS